MPATASAPMLTTGKPEALRISVGTADAPPVGPAATTVSNVSLLGPDLLRGPAAASSVAPAAHRLLPPRRRGRRRAAPLRLDAASSAADTGAEPDRGQCRRANRMNSSPRKLRSGSMAS